MRCGIALPQIGSAVGPEPLVMVAKRAEDLGLDSVWVLDRTLWPIIRARLIRSLTVLYRSSIKSP